MANLSIEELIARVRNYVGDRTDDETLSFVQDFTETVNNIKEQRNNNDAEEYNRLIKENDDAWRKRFRDTFFSKPIKEDTQKEEDMQEEFTGEDAKPKILKYEDLFKEEK